MISRWTVLKIGIALGAIYMYLKVRGRDAADRVKDVAS